MTHNPTDIDLARISELITSRFGLHFPIERWAMLSRSLVLAAKDFGFQDINGFSQWLLSSELNNDQIKILASHLTISETYFWREPNVFTALTDYILPELIRVKKEGEKSIRIWSTGCSTGEEPYSIAIALHRIIPKIKDWNISILATDINPKALDKAKTGIYGPWSFRNAPDWLKTRYFHHLEDRKYEIIPEIRKMVTFSGFNLTDENFLSSICQNQEMDIIFCRNVLIYFTNEWASKISQNLYHSLSEEGWLVVASCELSSDLFPQLTPVNFPGAIVYHKNKDEFSANNIYSSDSYSQLFFNTLPSLSHDSKIVKKEFIGDSQYTTLNENGYNEIKNPIQPEAALQHVVEPQLLLKTREDILNENKISIRLLATQGHLEEAHSKCTEAIEADRLSPGLYFLRASILQELDKSNEAIKSLKQAIFIDPDYIMGHFTLGNLFTRQGNTKNAIRYFKNALDLLNTISYDGILPESEGLSAKYLKEIILISLQTQKSI